jgi:hypothetical protein
MPAFFRLEAEKIPVIGGVQVVLMPTDGSLVGFLMGKF